MSEELDEAPFLALSTEEVTRALSKPRKKKEYEVIQPQEVDSVHSVTSDDIEKIFTYHPPQHSQPERYQLIRENAKRLAYIIKHNTPPSRERDRAIDHLDEAVALANAAIARNE